MEKRVYFEVHGLVQNVGFRYFTRKKAHAYGITGWCRNTPNNTVEGEAQGDQPTLQLFISDLGVGPSHASVSKVTHDERPAVSGEQVFEVRH
ncbi:Acylphosphatase [Escovopsis weberi]|uniref:acylphosphatase n=1 Tax=Escovopsis weberi TaxID=150374 RepID=A0A0M8MW12_ESCWE|nr:Acylphosphatase [Escovopsis weberi]